MTTASSQFIETVWHHALVLSNASKHASTTAMNYICRFIIVDYIIKPVQVRPSMSTHICEFQHQSSDRSYLLSSRACLIYAALFFSLFFYPFKQAVCTAAIGAIHNSLVTQCLKLRTPHVLFWCKLDKNSAIVCLSSTILFLLYCHCMSVSRPNMI